jgi:hypothetical protein
MSYSQSKSAAAFANLDNPGPLEKSYAHTLREAVKDDGGDISDESALHVHDILELVIFAREPLTLQAICDLLDMDRNELEGYLSTLCSVLALPDDASPDGVIRPSHQSFKDFVVQQGHLFHPKLAFDSAIAQKNIAERCIRQLNKLLHMNICCIQDPSLFNVEVPDLETLLKLHVSAALRYSCRFWVSHCLEHIRVAGREAQLPHGLDQFCAEHLLHWIEVLSLTGNLHDVQRTMPDLNAAVMVRHLALACCECELTPHL